MKGRIITIGDEILIGQVVDTNSAWLGAEFSQLGIDNAGIWTIRDTRAAIHEALNQVESDVDLVVMTGGLGPTKDDLTKKALAEWFESDWKTDEGVMNRVKEHFVERGVPVPEASLEQAQVPSVCTVLANTRGSAPGMWFEKNGTIFISMPGVPYEMKGIFTDVAKSLIRDRLKDQNIAHRTIMTQGVGESTLMQMLIEWEHEVAEAGLKLAYLPSAGSVRLRVSGMENGNQELHSKISSMVDRALPILGDFVYGFDEEQLEQVIGRLLKEQGLTLSTAESCTGGYISHMITSISGSSEYFKGSVTAYANETKVNILGVDSSALDEHGAVSKQVAIQMAEGVRQALNTDFAVSTTGVAGPSGGSADKPVGTVWIGIAGSNGSYAPKFRMGKLRESNIRKSAMQALQILRKEIISTSKLSAQDSLYLK